MIINNNAIIFRYTSSPIFVTYGLFDNSCPDRCMEVSHHGFAMHGGMDKMAVEI